MSRLSLPASSAFRWTKCPLSANVTRPEFVYEKSEAAIEGDIAHRYAAALLNYRINKNASQPAITDEITDEIQNAVDVYVSAVSDIANGEYVCVEGELIATAVHPENKCKIDCYLFNKAQNTVYIFEFKYGQTVVKPDESAQLINYAVALYTNLNTDDSTKYMLTVVQPRSLDGVQVKSSLWSSDEISCAALELGEAAILAESNHTLAVTGPHCQHCPAASICNMLDDECNGFNSVTVPCHNLSNDELSETMTNLRNMGKLLKARLDGLELDAVHRIKKGVQLKNYTLASSYSNLRWSLSDEAVLAMGAMFNVNLSAPLRAISPTQAIKVAKQHNVDPDIFTHCTYRVQGEPKLTYSKITKGN